MYFLLAYFIIDSPKSNTQSAITAMGLSVLPVTSLWQCGFLPMPPISSSVEPSTQPGGSTPMPGLCVGSLFGLVSVLQESPHVQQSILYSSGKPGGMGLLAAVEGSDCNVDVIIHWVVTHAVAIWHH